MTMTMTMTMPSCVKADDTHAAHKLQHLRHAHKEMLGNLPTEQSYKALLAAEQNLVSYRNQVDGWAAPVHVEGKGRELTSLLSDADDSFSDIVDYTAHVQSIRTKANKAFIINFIIIIIITITITTIITNITITIAIITVIVVIVIIALT